MQVQVRGRPPLPLSFALVAGRELAKELFQRGLLLYFLSQWLADRVLETGTQQVGGGEGRGGEGRGGEGRVERGQLGQCREGRPSVRPPPARPPP